jgi:hypothetical protein
MKKICPGCGIERDIETDFRWKYKDRGIRQRWCKFCQAEANRTHYQNNKQVYIDRAITRNTHVKTENKRRLHAYLSSHPCVDCSETDIRVLEFDHVRGNKTLDVAKLLDQTIPWHLIEAEITKCDVRCANCHRIKTIERGNWWRSTLSE